MNLPPAHERESIKPELDTTPVVVYDFIKDRRVIASAGYHDSSEPGSRTEIIRGEAAIVSHVEELLLNLMTKDDIGAGIDALGIGEHLPEQFGDAPEDLVEILVILIYNSQLDSDSMADLICRSEYGPLSLREGIRSAVQSRLKGYSRMDEALRDPLVRGYVEVQFEANGMSEPQAIAKILL